MPITEVKGPDGRLYQVEHPRGALESQIIKIAQSQAGPAPRRNTAVGNLLRAIPAGLAQSGYDTINELGQEIVGISAQREKAKFAFDAWAGNPSAKDKSLEDIEKRKRENQAAIQRYVGDTGDFAGEAFGVEEGRLSADVGRGLGQLPLMFITRGASAVPMAMTEVRKDAEETFATDYADMSDEQRDQVQLAQGLYSAFSVVANRIGLKSMGLDKLDDFFKAGKTVKGSVVKKVLKDSIKGSAGEFVTEAAEAAAQDQFARIYDPNRDYSWDDIKRYAYEGFVGGIVGGTVATGVSAVQTFAGDITGVPVEEKESGSSEPTEGSAPLGNYRTVEVTYKQPDGTVRVVPIAVNEGDNQQEVVEKELAGRYDPAYGVTVADIEPRVFSQEPDPTQEEVPVQPEAAVEQVLPEVVPQVVPTTEQAPEQEQAPAVRGNFRISPRMAKSKPRYRGQPVAYGSELELAVYMATAKGKNASKVRSELIEAGYSPAEINAMSEEVRAQMKKGYNPNSKKPISVAIAQDVTAEAAGVDRLSMSFKDVTKRTPEIQEQAKILRENIKAGDREQSRAVAQAADEFKPVQSYDFVPAPESNSEMRNALSKDKVNKLNAPVKDGAPVAVRLDIPAYVSTGTWVPVVHEQTSSFRPGTPMSYQATAVVDGATLGIVSDIAVSGIAAGKAKSTIATIKGNLKKVTPTQAKKMADKALKDPSYVQVGMDPERRGYFYNRETMQEVVAGDQAIQIGPLVLVKNPQYGATPSNEWLSIGPDVVAEAAQPVAKPVSTSAAAEKIQLKNLAPQANEDFFQFWARVLDTTGSRIKASPKNFLRVAEQAVSDTLQFFTSNPKFATYYETDKKLTRTYLEAVVGPVTDTEFNLYRILAGLTSPSTKLPDNIIDALRVFKLYKDNGNFNFIVPSRTEKGARTYDPVKTGFKFRSNTGATKATSILAIQKKIDEIGLDATIEYLLEPVTMTELISSKRSLGYKGVGKQSQVKQVVKQATGQDKLIPRMFMFGPKVGSYSMNTLGNVEYTTTDIWESRFIRSYFKGMLESGTGLPLNDTEQKIFQEFSSAFNEEFQKQTGQKLEPASLQAVRWFYILNAFQKTGYQYAQTDDTISGYTAKAAQKLYGVDPASGGQGTGTDSSQVPAGNRLFGQPLQDSSEISERYQGSTGLPVQEPRRITELDQDQAAVIGKAYDEMKHDPTNPEVRRAYEALVQETLDQYDAILDAGYSMELSNVEYDNSPDMIEDLRSRKVMRIFPTEEGFGSKGISAKARRENPMLADSGRTDKDGNPLLVNDVFRFVHDFFGHAKLGNGFGAIGEENAWNVHSLMFSPLAQRALASETRGQNAWVNFSGVNDAAFELRNKAREARKNGDTKEAKRLSNLAYSKMKFADQKIGLLPEEFSKSTYQDDVTAQATDTEVEDRGPRDTYDNGGQVQDAIEQEFDPIGEKINVKIVMRMKTDYVARYNATRGIIEYNPMLLLKRSKAGIRAAMREEIIHAAMHKVIMVSARKKFSMAEGGKGWTDFFGEFGKSLTDAERADIKDVYQDIKPDDYVGYGSEYSRAVIQNLLYGEFSEEYQMQSQGGPAWNTIVKLLRSVQAYMAKVLGPMIKTNPEAAQVIVDSVELLKAADPSIRPKSQDVVARAYDATDKNTAKENTEAGERVGKDSSERIREERKWFDGAERKTASKYLTPVITRLNRINPMFGRILQNLDSAIRMRSMGYRKQTEMFFNKLNAVKGAEFQELKQLMFFSPTPEEANLPSNKAKMQRRDALLHKHGLLNMYRLDVQPILEEIYTEYNELGMPKIGYLEDYFPRVIKDLEGLIKSYGHKTKRTFELLVREENIRRSEMKDADGNPAPLPEMQETELGRFFQDFLQGKFRLDLNGVKLPGNVKAREINFIDDDKLKFYDEPGVAFGKYTTNMARAIESFKVVGDTKKGEGRLLGELGKLTEQLFTAGQIDQADANELKSLTELITSQFQAENEILKSLGTLTYITTLINPGPVLVQIMDLYKVALYRGLGGVVSGTYRTVTGNRRFDIERDFGIAKTQLSAEFEDPSFLTKALDFGLSRLVPFRQMDTAMKHASIEAAYDDFVKKANAPVGSKKHQQLLDYLTIKMGPEDAAKAVTDLKRNKTNDSIYVKEALLSELLERQPLTYLQVPEGYQTDPSKRLFYKLSTFMLLDLNYNRQEFMNDLGGPGKTLQQRTVALRRLAYMATLLTMFGLPSDLLDDWIAGKDTYIPEHVMNNMLGMFGLSRYTTSRALNKGAVESVIQRFTPPAINIMIDGEQSLRSWVKGDKELFEIKSWRNSPLSDVWYYRTGGGVESQRKYQKKQRKEGITPTFDR